MNKGKSGRFIPVAIILTGFCLLGIALYGRDTTLNYKKSEEVLGLIDDDQLEISESEKEPACLFLWDSQDEASQQAKQEMPQVLKDMKVKVADVDIRNGQYPEISGFETVVAAFGDYGAAGEYFVGLMDWVKDGGRLLILCPPKADSVFRAFSQNMGIQSYSSDLYQVTGIRIRDGFMIRGDQADYRIEDPFESALLLEVNESSHVYLVSADEKEIPLLWSCDSGDGKVVFDNIGIYEKDFRGFHCAAYSLLEDACVWPVINGSAFYLDDFPAPTPVGSNFYTKRDYGINTADFYEKIWWPDILEIGRKYGIRYTGMLIASNDTETKPPYRASEDNGKYRYYGNLILGNGGEIGIHGFNHQPLVREGVEKEFKREDLDEMDYEKNLQHRFWESNEDIGEALRETDRFYQHVFSQETAAVYSPPDNILSLESRALLPQILPGLKAVTGSYESGAFVHGQEFQVAEDKIVELPRISSGVRVDQYDRISIVSELNMHFVGSHSIRPEDVFNADKGAGEGWEILKKDLAGYLEWFYGASPKIRNLTGSELAAAVQRFYYIDVTKTMTQEQLSLDLDNFKDEAWFFLRMNTWEPKDPESCVKGGTLKRLEGNLYLLKAEESHVEINREVK